MCYAELVLTFPKAGSDYTYLREGFGPSLAFLYIWVEVVFMEGCGKAIGALTFSTYFCQMFYFNCAPPDSLKRIVAGLTYSGS
jgi:L-type amino acid transporter 9